MADFSRLAVETVQISESQRVIFLAGLVDFPGQKEVTVVIHAPPGRSVEDSVVVFGAAPRAESLVANLSQILVSGIPHIHQEFLRCYPDSSNIPPKS